MKRIIVITGASSGMGFEFALQADKMFKAFDEFYLIARRKDRLNALARQLTHPCRIIDGSLTEAETLNRLVRMLQRMLECGSDCRFEHMPEHEPEREAGCEPEHMHGCEPAEDKIQIKMLVNAAGFGKYGRVSGLSAKEQEDMTDLNCRALVSVTKICLPYMAYNGRIINIASSAAFLPQPGFAVYAASKAYVLSFTRALSRELADKKIYVTAVCPGPVDTEFFDTALAKSEKRPFYKDLVMARCDRVVRKALKDSISKKTVSVYGIPMKIFRIFAGIVPHDIILKFIGKH